MSALLVLELATALGLLAGTILLARPETVRLTLAQRVGVMVTCVLAWWLTVALCWGTWHLLEWVMGEPVGI